MEIARSVVIVYERKKKEEKENIKADKRYEMGRERGQGANEIHGKKGNGSDGDRMKRKGVTERGEGCKPESPYTLMALPHGCI